MGTHEVPESEVDSLLPPTYRRRTKSVRTDEGEEDPDDPLAIAAEAETSEEEADPDVGQGQDDGGDQGNGDDQGNLGAAPVDPNDPMYDLYQDFLRQQQAQAQAQAAPVAGPPPPQPPQQQQQPQVAIRAEDVEAALRAMHGDDPAGVNSGVQQAAAAATDKSAEPAKKSGTR